jgi:hypothetical protein
VGGGFERKPGGGSLVQNSQIGGATSSPGKRTLTEQLGKRPATLAEAGGGRIAERVGVDARAVRVHEDGVAESMGARAVAMGRDLHFAANELGGPDSDFLVGHELAHVVQQERGATSMQAKRAGTHDRSALEAEADRVGHAVAGGASVVGTIEGRATPGLAQKLDAIPSTDPDVLVARAATNGAGSSLPHLEPGGEDGGSASSDSAALLAEMGKAFGADFSDVQIHHGDGVAESMGAEAATQGDDVHVAAHRDPEDKRLLGHELAHVVQQREGRVDGPQGKDDGLVADAGLEAEADRAGDAIASGQPVPEELRSHGGAQHAAAAPLQLNRDPLKGIDLYLYVNSTGIWAALKEHLARVPWPDPHPDVQFLNEPKFGALVWAWLQDGGLFLDEPQSIRRLVFPALHQEVLAPLLPTYTRTWLPGIGKAFAELIEDAARASLSRVGARCAGSAEHDARSEAHADQIVKSHPMDHAVTAALVQRGIVRYVPKAGKPDKSSKPREVKLVKLEWQGSRDQALWNWVKAPPDATVEDVAASLWPKHDDTYPGQSGSTRAYGLTEAPPWFGVPPGWAMDFPDARRYAPAGDVGPERGLRMAALASSRIDDEVAIAQSHTDATKAQTPKAEALQTTLGDSLIAAAYLHRALSPWKQGPAIETLIAWIKEKRSKVTTMPATELGTWAPIIDGQKDRLKRIVGGVKGIVDKTSGLGVKDPTSPDGRPLASVLDTYAQAAALSHLSDTGEQLIAEAGQQQQQLAILMLRGVTNDMKNAVGVASQSNQTGIAELSKESITVAADAQKLQDQLAAGLPADSASLEEATLHAQEIAFKTRVQGLFWSIRSLRMAVDQAGDGLASHIARTFHGSFKSLQQAIVPVEGTINQIVIHQQSEESLLKGNWESAAEQRGFRRDALVRNQKLLDELQRHTDLVEFLREGADTVKWQHFATGCVHMLALIGISIVAGAAGGMVARTVGSALTRVGSTAAIAEIAEGGGMLARAGSLAARGAAHLAGPATEAGIITAAQVKLQGGSAGDAFFTNLLSTIGANAIMGTLSKDLALVRSIEMRTAQHWTQRAGKLVLKETVAISAHTIMNVALGYLAHRIVTHKRPTAMMAQEWIMQGVAMGVGRYAGRFINARKPGHEQLGKLPEALGGKLLLTAGDELAALAANAETKPSEAATSEVFAKQHQVIEQELRVLELVEKNPALLRATPGIKLSIKDVAAAIGQLRAEQRALQPEMRRFVLHAAGLEEIVPGSEYRGSAEQMRRAIEAAHTIGLPVGTLRSAAGKTVVKLGDAEITLHDGPPTEAAPPKRTPEEQFLESVRLKLGDAELIARFNKIVGKRPAKKVHEQFKGDVEAARNLVVDASARDAAAATAAGKAAADSAIKTEELRRWVADENLMMHEAPRAILEQLRARLASGADQDTKQQAFRTAHQKLRAYLISQHLLQMTLPMKFPKNPKIRIRTEVQVWQEQIPPAGEPAYTSAANYKARRAAEIKGSDKGVKLIDTADGPRIFIEVTDLDFLVTEHNGGNGRDRMIHAEEVKAGGGETHDGARSQQDAAFDAVREAARGGRKVMLLEGSKGAWKDVTGDFDLSSLARENMKTRGPEGRGFDESLGMSPDDLDAMVANLIGTYARLPPP